MIIAHERTDYTKERLSSGVLDAVIAKNPGHLVRSAIRVLRARSERREPLASQERIRIEIYTARPSGRTDRAPLGGGEIARIPPVCPEN
ncbi:type 1 periplasmic-binding domain-containing protein [Salipiger thiooxidans]|uniref:hypothetical protein n=1 Tax=Salipiger thiooxidans TaxID=282683 RepID=UPI001CD2BD8F|nr:hypothetical protein [Salipiger thiooxidans]MCA0846250.1 hypothetical protein [Salipiger thiooxidans]